MTDAGSGPALRVEHLSKSFPGTQALRDASLAVAPGEMHALVGSNGSGKSTLIRALSGVRRADKGVVTVGAQAIDAGRLSPAWARTAGLRFVHQDPTDFPELSLAENLGVSAGFDTTRANTIVWKQLRARTRALLDRFHVDAGPDTPVHRLSMAERALFAVARVLEDADADRPRVFVLDEPTASLPAEQAAMVWATLRDAARDGHSVLFVTHRLEEVVAHADVATVLRDGVVTDTVTRDELDEARLVALIVGPDAPAPSTSTDGVNAGKGNEVALELRDLRGRSVDGASVTVRRGEIVGIAGPLGSGRSELLRMVFGADKPRGGTITIDGIPRTFRSIGEAMHAGVAYVPPDRDVAAFGDRSLAENLSAAAVGTYWRAGRMRRRAERADARESMHAFAIRASDERQSMVTLSGGNQQKAVVARWLRRAPKVLLLDEPTHGVDVGARRELADFVVATARAGCAVVIVSDELTELARLCDRVLVMVDGRVVADLDRAEVTVTRLTELAFGSASPAA
jgi:ribose transport system ATP-binding protein